MLGRRRAGDHGYQLIARINTDAIALPRTIRVHPLHLLVSVVDLPAGFAVWRQPTSTGRRREGAARMPRSITPPPNTMSPS